MGDIWSLKYGVWNMNYKPIIRNDPSNVNPEKIWDIKQKKTLDVINESAFRDETKCRLHEETKIIQQDALSFLNNQPKNSFDYIVSFAFLECFSNDDLKFLKLQMDRVAKKQIHYCFKDPNPIYYNTEVNSIISEVKTIG